MAMLIPIFLSCPSDRSTTQRRAPNRIIGELDRAGLEWRSLGKPDCPTTYPIREVLVIAKHGSGGVIPGFSQFEVFGGIWRRGSKTERRQRGKVAFSTPWNHLEVGILFSLGLPLLLFSEGGVQGGVFGHGVTDVFINAMPRSKISKSQTDGLREVILKWSANVRQHYYGVPRQVSGHGP